MFLHQYDKYDLLAMLGHSINMDNETGIIIITLNQDLYVIQPSRTFYNSW